MRSVQALRWPGFVTLIGVHLLNAQSVSVSSGNIVFHPKAGAAHQLTTGGLDAMPALSPDGRSVVFVRRTPRDTVNTSLGWEERTELFLVHVDGTNEHKLLAGREGTSPETSLAQLKDPVFSLDGQTVYFGSTGWVTSDALHAVAISNGRERLVCGANGFELLRLGKYRGDLMVGQHRYGDAGSYDGTWIVSPNGSILKQVTLDGAPDAEARIAEARAGKGPDR